MDRSTVAAADRSAALRSAAQGLGLELTREQEARLLGYVDLLARWNQRINLTAVRDPRQMLVQHLFDCLAVLPALDRQFAGLALRVLDVGSGAGLPGVPWAVMQPEWSVTCVDAVAKKSSFVRQAAGELGIANLHAEHARVEALRAGPFDLITSRAFASLADFIHLTRHLLADGGFWVALKGVVPDAEIAELDAAHVDMFHVEQVVVPELQAQRCLVWMRPRRVGAAPP
jgi:16S rRNA (guanine527-N7)-methyltransferase